MYKIMSAPKFISLKKICFRFWQDYSAKHYQWSVAAHQRQHHYRRRASQQASQAANMLRPARWYILCQPYPETNSNGKSIFPLIVTYLFSFIHWLAQWCPWPLSSKAALFTADLTCTFKHSPYLQLARKFRFTSKVKQLEKDKQIYLWHCRCLSKTLCGVERLTIVSCLGYQSDQA